MALSAHSAISLSLAFPAVIILSSAESSSFKKPASSSLPVESSPVLSASAVLSAAALSAGALSAGAVFSEPVTPSVRGAPAALSVVSALFVIVPDSGTEISGSVLLPSFVVSASF